MSETDTPAARSDAPPAEDLTVVGRDVRRVDGRAKVTGEARYAGDLYPDRCLHAAVKHAEYPHAQILSVQTRKALELDGVVAVLTGMDVPREPWGNVIQDMPFIAHDRVRYLGDGVALIAAETPDIARRAAELVEVSYTELPGLFDPEQSLADGAPRLGREGNLIVHHKVREGDVEQGLAQADEVLDLTFRTPFIEHAYLEPEAAVALPEPDGGITVHLTTQHPYSARKVVAAALGLPLHAVRIVQPPLGGGFGGKDDNASLVGARAALLARATGRPVKLVLSREESFLESYKRHPYRMRYRIGARRDGTLVAAHADILADGGAYASMSPFVTWRSVVQATGPYRVPNVKTDVRAVYTNNTYTGAMRGFGSPQVCFAVESAMDILAARLEIDPLELRLRNAYREGDTTPTGQVLTGHTVSLQQVIRIAAERAGWPGPAPGGDRALGMACSYRGVSLGAEGADQSTASLTVHPDGSVDLAVGVAENGQGLMTAMAQIAAETLGCGLDRVRVLQGNTAACPDGGPTVASRGTIAGGGAVLRAAGQVRRLMDAARTVKGDAIGWDELVAFCHGSRIPLSAQGHWSAPRTSWNEHTGKGDAYFTWVYGCQVADASVDRKTGGVTVHKVTAVHDVGRSVFPQGVRGQILGGVVMGLGYGLTEEFLHEDGRALAHNFDHYHVPRIQQAPEIDAVAVENPDPAGPYGAKSLGEPTNELAAPAVANAVARACGARVLQLPLNHARVKAALEGGDA